MRSSAAALPAARGAAASRLPRQCVVAPAALSRRATLLRRGGAQRLGCVVTQVSLFVVRRGALRGRAEALPLTCALRRQDAMSNGLDSTVVVAGLSGVWGLAFMLTKLHAGQETETMSREAGFKSLKDEFLAAIKSLKDEQMAANKSLKDEFLAANKSLKDELLAANKSLKDELLAALSASSSGSVRAFLSISVGLQQLDNCDKLTAFAAATSADVAALLRVNSFGQYADALSSLNGVKALTQTEAQLRALGVAEGHVQPLLALFAKQQ